MKALWWFVVVATVSALVWLWRLISAIPDEELGLPPWESTHEWEDGIARPARRAAEPQVARPVMRHHHENGANRRTDS